MNKWIIINEYWDYLASGDREARPVLIFVNNVLLVRVFLVRLCSVIWSVVYKLALKMSYSKLWSDYLFLSIGSNITHETWYGQIDTNCLVFQPHSFVVWTCSFLDEVFHGNTQNACLGAPTAFTTDFYLFVTTVRLLQFTTHQILLNITIISLLSSSTLHPAHDPIFKAIILI